MEWFASIIVLTWPKVVGIVSLCLLAEGFFSGSELALVSCDKLRLRQRAARGCRQAQLAESLVKNPARLFSITLIGTNLATITAATVTTLFLIKQYGPAYGPLAILVAPVILIFAEILPKSIFQHNADRLVDRVARPLLLFRTLLYPAIRGLALLTNRLLGGVRKASGAERRMTREEVEALLQGEEALRGDIRPIERTMIARILRLSEQRAKNIMIPLVELEVLPRTATREAAFAIFDLKGYSHLLVYSGRAFNIVGVLEACDVLFASKEAPVETLLRTPVFVPEEMPLSELFRHLRERKEVVAVVVDEYGGAVGMAMLEDIFEEVVGEIRDEFSLDEQLLQILGEGRFLVQARMEIEEAEAEIGCVIPRDDYETIGGFLLHHFGRIPQVGETMTVAGWCYRVHHANDRAILSVEIRRIP